VGVSRLREALKDFAAQMMTTWIGEQPTSNWSCKYFKSGSILVELYVCGMRIAK